MVEEETQDVGWLGIVHELVVQGGDRGVVDEGHADFGIVNAGVGEDGFDGEADASAIDRHGLLAIRDVDGDAHDYGRSMRVAGPGDGWAVARRPSFRVRRFFVPDT